MAALSLVLVGVLEWLALPAALLLGPMVVAIVFALRGAELAVPPLAFRLAQSIVGCMIARILTPPVLREVGQDWPLFLGGVGSVILASTALGWMLARMRVLPGSTAIWGSAPGAASAMVLMSASFGADIRLVAFMQYTRVVIVALLAALVARFWAEPGGPGLEIGWLAQPDWKMLGLTLLLAGGSVALGRFTRLPAAPMLLPLIFGTLLQTLGVMVIELPPLLLALAYAFIGWGIGLRFDRVVIRHAARALPRVLAAILCLVVLCGGLAALLVVFAGIDPLSAYLATSPGGADTVAIIASSADVDVAFVMAMQTARFLLILITGPPIARFVAKRLG